MAVEDITSGNESTIPVSKKGLVEEGHLYADQNGNENAVRDENEIRDSVSGCNRISDFMQCELPVLMISHVVKEICIDENQNGDMTREREDSESLTSTGSKSSFENDYSEDDIQEWGTKEREVDMKTLLSDTLKSLSENHVVDDIGNDSRSLALVQTGEANYTATVRIENAAPRGKSLKSLFESDDSDGYEEDQWQSDQIPRSGAESKSLSLVSTTEGANKSSPVNDLSCNSKVESAKITFDSENDISGVSAFGSEIQSQGEASFSMACHVSGLITYSGPMTYSGSVSLRSDSSTTSTQSFAFPVIQSECYSSPIRMAKADRRHYMKHRGWREGLLCFRF